MPDPMAGLPPRFLRTPEAARYLGLSGRTLEKHRTYGTGPTYRKIGGRVVYAVDDLKAWADLGAKTSTSWHRDRPTLSGHRRRRQHAHRSSDTSVQYRTCGASRACGRTGRDSARPQVYAGIAGEDRPSDRAFENSRRTAHYAWLGRRVCGHHGEARYRRGMPNMEGAIFDTPRPRATCPCGQAAEVCGSLRVPTRGRLAPGEPFDCANRASSRRDQGYAFCRTALRR